MAATTGWVSSTQMADELGIERKTLFRMRDDGTLRLGTHYAAFKGKTFSRDSFLWHKRTVRKTMDKLTKPVVVPDGFACQEM